MFNSLDLPAIDQYAERRHPPRLTSQHFHGIPRNSRCARENKYGALHDIPANKPTRRMDGVLRRRAIARPHVLAHPIRNREPAGGAVRPCTSHDSNRLCRCTMDASHSVLARRSNICFRTADNRNDSRHRRLHRRSDASQSLAVRSRHCLWRGNAVRTGRRRHRLDRGTALARTTVLNSYSRRKTKGACQTSISQAPHVPDLDKSYF
jgi:hypothetical protein